MASDKINLKVYTPAGLVLDTQASSVTLPTSDGDIGILPHHVRYIGLLGTGILEYFELGSNTSNRLVVSNGFCNFVNETLVVLADSADLPADIDKASYAKERESLQKVLQTSSLFEPDAILASQKLQRIDAIERLIGH